MWTMLRQYLAPEAAIEQARGFKQGSWVKEHAEHANWENLTDLLKELCDNWSTFINDRKMSIG